MAVNQAFTDAVTRYRDGKAKFGDATLIVTTLDTHMTENNLSMADALIDLGCDPWVISYDDMERLDEIALASMRGSK